jgi:hypothetical protein
MALFISLGGCRGREIETTYGRMSGSPGRSSVNGTSVLASMMRDAGFQVSRWSRMSPRLSRADVIVWAPDDFQPPAAAQRAFLDDWLAARPNRTLIYVGRHYDAAVDYYGHIRRKVRGQQAIEASRRAARAQARFDRRRYGAPEGDPSGWFQTPPGLVLVRDRGWSGAWAEGLPEPARPRRTLGRWVWPAPDGASSSTPGGASSPTAGGASSQPLRTAVLVRWGGEPLIWEATRPSWSGSRILLVRDGSLVLNLPLVDPANRQLAGRLVAACRGQSAVFLESGPGGPDVSEQEQSSILGLAAFRVWPLSIVLLHWTMVGIVFCLAVFPVFGRPRRLPAEPTADFGAHIQALGQLLERRRPRAWAQQRLQHARQLLGIAEPDADPGNPFRREPQT